MAAPTRLLAGLVDDAAVFPPGDAPLPRALAEHRQHRRAWYAPMIGPLLVPAAGVAELVGLVGAEEDEGGPVDVVVVARPGTPTEDVTQALDTASGTDLHVRGVELGWHEGWRDLPLGDLPVVLEIPRGEDHDRALADVRDGRAEGRAVLAKLRTGVTPTWEWPDETELAGFLADAVALGIPVKLTGGLHHVVRADHDGEPQHGLLNVLVALDIAHGAAHDEPGRTEVVAEVLRRRDPVALAAVVASWADERAARVRRTLTAYGCCGVTDPVTELSDLDLVAGAS